MKSFTRQFLRRNERGFTLVELMVAVALLGVIIVALMMAFQQAQRAFRVGANQADVLESGRAIMSLISRDIQEMSYTGISNGYNFYAGVSPKASPLVTSLPNSSNIMILGDLFFLTSRNDEWGSIRYACDENQLASGVATLYRKITNSTVENVQTITRLDDATEPATNFVAFRRVADGVVHFRIEAFNAQGWSITPGSPEAQFMGISVTPTPNAPPNVYTYGFTYTNMPAFVDIELGILEPQTLKALEARVSALPPAQVNQFCRDYLFEKSGKIHIFRQRIPIRTQCRIDL